MYSPIVSYSKVNSVWPHAKPVQENIETIFDKTVVIHMARSAKRLHGNFRLKLVYPLLSSKKQNQRKCKESMGLELTTLERVWMSLCSEWELNLIKQRKWYAKWFNSKIHRNKNRFTNYVNIDTKQSWLSIRTSIWRTQYSHAVAV